MPRKRVKVSFKLAMFFLVKKKKRKERKGKRITYFFSCTFVNFVNLDILCKFTSSAIVASKGE